MTTDARGASQQAVWRHSEDLEQLLNQVWESLTEVPSPLAFRTGPMHTAPDEVIVQAQTRMDGTWTGDVTVSAAQPVAEAIARQMMAMTPDEALDPCDVDDAMGEIANIIGGNLKSLLASVVRLSLPMVRRTDSSQLSTTMAGAPVYEGVALWDERQVLVQVHDTTKHSSGWEEG